MGSYPNNQTSQLSPRLSQGSPAPPNYPSGGALLPQVSPTGPSVPGQQSPAWSGSSPQHRSSSFQQQQQNPMINVRHFEHVFLCFILRNPKLKLWMLLICFALGLTHLKGKSVV